MSPTAPIKSQLARRSRHLPLSPPPAREGQAAPPHGLRPPPGGPPTASIPHSPASAPPRTGAALIPFHRGGQRPLPVLPPGQEQPRPAGPSRPKQPAPARAAATPPLPNQSPPPGAPTRLSFPCIYRSIKVVSFIRNRGDASPTALTSCPLRGRSRRPPYHVAPRRARTAPPPPLPPPPPPKNNNNSNNNNNSRRPRQSAPPPPSSAPPPSLSNPPSLGAANRPPLARLSPGAANDPSNPLARHGSAPARLAAPPGTEQVCAADACVRLRSELPLHRYRAGNASPGAAGRAGARRMPARFAVPCPAVLCRAPPPRRGAPGGDLPAEEGPGGSALCIALN